MVPALTGLAVFGPDVVPAVPAVPTLPIGLAPEALPVTDSPGPRSPR